MRQPSNTEHDYSARASSGAERPWRGLALGYILLPLVLVTWLAFFRQEIPSFPPEGYSLKWFGAVLNNKSFVSGFLLSFQTGVAATLIGLALGGAGKPCDCAAALPRTRLRQRAAADAADRPRRRARPVDLRVPDRDRDRDRPADARLAAGLIAAHVLIVVPWTVRLVTASLAGLRPAIEEAAKNLGATPLDDVLARHPARHPARHRRGGAVRLRHLVRQSGDEPVSRRPGRTTLPIAILQYLEWKIDPTVAAVSVLQIALIGAAMMVTDHYVKISRVV